MIQHNFALPAPNKGTGVEIFNAADAQRCLLGHSLGAGKLRLGARLRCRSVLTVSHVTVITVTLNRNASSFPDSVLKSGDCLLLGCRRTGHMKDFFLHDRSMQIISAVTE